MSRSPPTSGAARSAGDYVAGWQATLQLLRQGKSWSGSERNRAFLNCGSPVPSGRGASPPSQSTSRFANISASSGLDFPDDGRGLAVVDWDGDGDLDLWLSNRTGPRLRLMLNRGAGRNGFVAFRLRGTVVNRDAIGARVEVELGGAARGKLVRTLYAGDAFLSQSSKWLHFGLGRNPEILGVKVRWPGGESESFGAVAQGRRYLLVEGSGEAVMAAPRRKVVLEPAPQEVPPAAATARIFLPERVAMPRLRHTRFDSSAETAVDVAAKPLLVNFWATWCLPCLAELQEMVDREGDIRSAGLDVLALSVDGLGNDQATSPADARRLLAKLRFPFATGLATRQLLDKIELVQEVLFDRTLPFAVPLSFLLDRSGRLAAIYRGRFETDALLRDVARLDAPPQQLHAASAPLGGRWIARLPGVGPLALAKVFAAYPEDMERFLGLALANQRAARAAAESPEARGALDREEASILLGLAEAGYQQGRRQDAFDHLARAIELDPEQDQAHLSLAGLLRQSDRTRESIPHYRRAIAIDPLNAEAHQGLGLALRGTGELDQALHHLETAADLRPEWPAPLIPLAWLLITTAEDGDTGQAREAVRRAERVLELTGNRHPVALDTLAAAYAAAGRIEDAVKAASEAITKARAMGNETLAEEIAGRRRSYQGHSSD